MAVMSNMINCFHCSFPIHYVRGLLYLLPLLKGFRLRFLGGGGGRGGVSSKLPTKYIVIP